jgi:hypothetical protein
VLSAFPGPLHEGNGTLQAIIDERATPAQREALFGILSGQNSAEGTIFHIFSLIVTRMLDPIFAPIRFDFDLPGRRAMISIPGVLEVQAVKGNERQKVLVDPQRGQVVKTVKDDNEQNENGREHEDD